MPAFLQDAQARGGQAVGATRGRSTSGRRWQELGREPALLLDLGRDLVLPLPGRPGGLVTDCPAVNEHARTGTQLLLACLSETRCVRLSGASPLLGGSPALFAALGGLRPAVAAGPVTGDRRCLSRPAAALWTAAFCRKGVGGVGEESRQLLGPGELGPLLQAYQRKFRVFSFPEIIMNVV